MRKTALPYRGTKPRKQNVTAERLVVMSISREAVLKNFPDATREQVDSMMALYNSEIEKSKKKMDELKSAQEKIAELEAANAEMLKKQEEVEEGKLSEIEKVTKDLEKANARVAELERMQMIANQRGDAVAKFKITSEQAKEVIKDDGSFDMDKLGSIMAEKESAAALAKEQEIAALSTNPNVNGHGDDGKSIAVEIATKAAQRAGTANQNILDAYRR